MSDRNADLAKALGNFKAALVTHLSAQPGITADDPEVVAAVDRILSKTATALAEESFSLEEHCVRHILHGLMYSS